MSKLFKILAVGALAYGAYKLGEHNANKKINQTLPEDKPEEKDTEEDYILELINELKNKPNKTKKDKYNLELLEIKLNQILNKK